MSTGISKRAEPTAKLACALQSKEQLKKLRAEKAASAQQTATLASAQRAKAAAAAMAAQARQKSAAGMPPPAPRAPSGSLPASTGNKSAISVSSGKPQAAIIRPKSQAAGERSVNRIAQESAVPSGMLLKPVNLQEYNILSTPESELRAAHIMSIGNLGMQPIFDNLLQFMQTGPAS